MIKTGDRHAASLRDGRQVYLDGALVDDVTTHPAYRNAVRSIGGLYDFQSAPQHRELMTYTAENGDRCSRIWQFPRSYGDLVARRRAIGAWCELHAGFLGRSPDHVASTISGMYMGLEVFADYDHKRAVVLEDYYHFARDNDLYLTYVIINPQADRSKAAHEQGGEHLTAAVVDEDAGGLTVHGAKMLATGGIMANEILVASIQPLQPGDENYAISFALPLATPGLKVLSRKSYEQSAGSVFDNPFAARFDENDAVIYFDNVRVPWERVFVDRDIEMCRKQFHATPAHIYQNYQAQIRLRVKLRFLVGVARRIAEVNGTLGFPQVRETLGALAAEVGMVGHGDGGARRHGRRVLRTAPAHGVRRAGDYPEALRQGDRLPAGAGRRRADHAAFERARFRQPGAGGADRGHPAVAGRRRAQQSQVLPPGVGRDRLRVRLAPRAVRAALRRRAVRDARPLVPHLRLGPRHRSGRPHARLLPARG